MKRAANSDAKDETVAKIPRQTPVSCKNCRAKKLKCDRNAPCFNCSSRGIHCSYGDGVGPRGITHLNETQFEAATQDLVAARLDRVEQLLLSLTGRSEPQQSHLQATSQLTNKTQDKDRPIDSQVSSSTDDDQYPPPSHEREIERRLEEAAHNVLTSFVPFGAFSQRKDFLKVHVLPLRSMISVAATSSLNTEVFLPTYAEAYALLEDYIEHVEHIHRLIHIPTSRFHLQDMYDALKDGKAVSPARVALYLGIFANSAARATTVADKPSPFTVEESSNFAVLWQHIALDILDKLIRIRTNTPSLEQLQATLVLSHPCNYLEGLSFGFRHLMSSAIIMAREMGIHRLDHSMSIQARRRASSEELVDVEMRRRLWWHIVATDWLLASVASPQEHVYNIHPAHFQVNKPLNADDEQLLFLVATPNMIPPVSLPSEMSFELLRIELGIICREIVDDMPHSDASIDRFTDRLHGLLESLPPFLRSDDASKRLCRAIHMQRPYLALQGVLGTAGAHFRIAELHRVRLVQLRQANDSETRLRCAASRAICLESSRAVIKCGQGPAGIWSQGAFVHHYFMAALALALDLHQSPSSRHESIPDPGQQRAERAEIQEACDVMIRMQRSSTTVQRLLKPLMDVLKRASDRAAETSGAASIRADLTSTQDESMAKTESSSKKPTETGAYDMLYFDPFTDMLDTAALGFDDETFNMFLRDINPGFATF